MNAIRKKAWLGLVATAVCCLSLAAGPAASASPAAPADPKSADVCWLAAETGVLQCFEDEAAMDRAILEQTGAVLVEEGSFAARSTSSAVAAASLYPISRMFENADYGGAYLTVSAPSTTFCVNSSIQLSNIGLAWNDRVSSVLSYYGCLTRLWSNTGYTGSVGTFNDAGTLGALNNAASSYKVY
jgi:hypothetical protein